MRRIPFGSTRVTESSKRRLADIAESGWLTEGKYVREFEERYAEKFGWKHCVATSSGTTAGEIVWAAIREIEGVEHGGNGAVITPACAFVATANCILAAGLKPKFVDVSLETLNMDPSLIHEAITYDRYLKPVGIQFVMTMGKPAPIADLAHIAGYRDLWLVSDSCEAHGTKLHGKHADKMADAAIYSFYPAHLLVGGEGGAVCTDNDHLAALCRSLKSHGRPLGSGYFDFQRPAFNAKWNEMCAAVALGSLEEFDHVWQKRREVRRKLLDALRPFDDELILYDDGPDEEIAPHAFPVMLRNPRGDGAALYWYIEAKGIECKTLFGSLPTQHAAFPLWRKNRLNKFPVAEMIGRTGLHFGCGQDMTDGDIAYIADAIGEYFRGR